MKEFCHDASNKAITQIVLSKATCVYVGQSIEEIQVRAEKHLRSKDSKITLNFEFFLLGSLDNAEAANVAERMLINVLQQHPKVPSYLNVQNCGVKRKGPGNFSIYLATANQQSEMCQQKA